MTLSVLMVAWSAFSMAETKQVLKSLEPTLKKGKLIVEMNFDGPVTKDRVNVEYINNTIQFNIKDAHTEEDKIHNRLNGKTFKSVYTYQASSKTLRIRVINQKKFKAEDFKELVKIQPDGNKITFEIHTPSSQPVVAKVDKKLPVVPPIDLDAEIERASLIVGQSENQTKPVPLVLPEKEEPSLEKFVAKNKVTEKNSASKVNDKILKKELDEKIDITKGLIDKEDRPESEIPVFRSKKKTEKSAGIWNRLIMSLGVIGIVGLGILMFGKWWSVRKPGMKQDQQIKVMTQYHLGPKKSLAIIRVAGESILIGVTDHNINLIKSLSLLDEEIPTHIPSHFGDELKKSQEKVTINQKKKSPEEPQDEFAYGNIKEMVASKLKEMRPL